MAAQLQHAERLCSAVASFLAKLCTGPLTDKQDFKRNLIVLSRLVDFAVASAQLPPSTADIVQLLRLVWLQRNDVSLRPAIMVLLISVKSACLASWFNASESEELLTNFSTFSEQFTGDRCLMGSPQDSSSFDQDGTLQFIDKINSRFFPWLKVNKVILSVETKPGYEVLLNDFNVSQPQTQQERLRLYICHKSIETSACLTSPPQVNILLNGKGVDKRTTVSMDTGPQVPSDVTHLLRVGCNLLQAVGEFTESYVIAVATVATVDYKTSVELQDYFVQSCPLVAGSNCNLAPDMDDDDVIEGPSRVSLHCPISHKRITTPVKGVSCKHHQCFDYHNYIEINERRPAWRCPYCNTPACFPDLRLDRHMAQVIRDATKVMKTVMILPDGSWEPTPCEELAELSCSSALLQKTSSLNPDRCVSAVIDLSTKGGMANSMTEAPMEGSDVGSGISQELHDCKPDLYSLTASLNLPALGSIFVQDFSTLATAPMAGLSRLQGSDGMLVLPLSLESSSQGVDERNLVVLGAGNHLTCPVFEIEQHGGGTSPPRTFFNHVSHGWPGDIGSALAGYSVDISVTGEGIQMPATINGLSEVSNRQTWASTAVHPSIVVTDSSGRATVALTYMGNEAGDTSHSPTTLLPLPTPVPTEVAQENGPFRDAD